LVEVAGPSDGGAELKEVGTREVKRLAGGGVEKERFQGEIVA
jgi:hypothetical protein